MLVVGSAALRFWGIDLPRKKSSDLDVVAYRHEYERIRAERAGAIRKITDTRHGHALHFNDGSPIMEFEIATEGSSADDLLKIMANIQAATGADEMVYASAGIVFALKMSHRFLRNSPHFQKTMDDIIALRKMDIAIPSYLEGEWMKKRQKETYYYAHPTLDKSKQDFFKDDVPYKYDHDSIHEAIRLFSRPAFEYIKKDAAEVYCSKEKFEAVSEAIRLATVLEESYVLALERHQIPNGFKPDPRRSFEIALKKVCTSIASGWWRTYAWEHYYEALALFDERYVTRFHDALQAGRILPYETPREAA